MFYLNAISWFTSDAPNSDGVVLLNRVNYLWPWLARDTSHRDPANPRPRNPDSGIESQRAVIRWWLEIGWRWDTYMCICAYMSILGKT